MLLILCHYVQTNVPMPYTKLHNFQEMSEQTATINTLLSNVLFCVGGISNLILAAVQFAGYYDNGYLTVG